MRTLKDDTGKREIVFLSQDDKDFLIYMSSDVWITPEVKRFKNDLLKEVWAKSNHSNSDS